MSGRPEPGLGPRLSKAHLEVFRDGVFAAAITLLALDLRAGDDLGLSGFPPAPLSGLLLAQLLAYVLGFLATGVMWVNHHRFLAVVERVDHGLLYRNLRLVGAVANAADPTPVLAHYVTGEAAEGGNLRVAVALYSLGLGTLSIASIPLWAHVRAPPRLRVPWTRRLRAEFRRSAGAIVAVAAILALDLASPPLALAIWAGTILMLAFSRPRLIRSDSPTGDDSIRSTRYNGEVRS